MKIKEGNKQATLVRIKNYGPRCMNESNISADRENNIISIWTKFFNYSLSQSYFIDKNHTQLKFTLTYKTPKWLMNKLQMVSKTYVHSSYAYKYDHILMYEYDKDYLFSISFYNPYEYTVSVNTKREGLAFLSTYHMIEQKHEIMKPYKRFMDSFKKMDAEQIKSIIRQVKNEDSQVLIKEHLDFSIDGSVLININNYV